MVTAALKRCDWNLKVMFCFALLSIDGYVYNIIAARTSLSSSKKSTTVNLISLDVSIDIDDEVASLSYFVSMNDYDIAKSRGKHTS